MRIAAVYDEIVRVKVRRKVGDYRINDLARGHEQHYIPRALKL